MPLQGSLRGLKALVTTHQNGGGQTPQGNANGVPTVTTTPNGKNEPPGHIGRKLLEVGDCGLGLLFMAFESHGSAYCEVQHNLHKKFTS